MLLSYRILTLILSLSLSFNILYTAQDASDLQVAKQEKPTLRKKIIKWGGIITGIGATIAGAAWLYFHNAQSNEAQRLAQLDAIQKLKQAPDINALEELYYSAHYSATGYYGIKEIRETFATKRDEFIEAYKKQAQKRYAESEKITNKQELLASINKAQTRRDFDVLYDDIEQNIGTAKGFKTMAEYRQLMDEDSDVIDAYYSREPVTYIRKLKDIHDLETPTKRAEELQHHIGFLLINKAHNNQQLNERYAAIQKANDQEVKDALRSDYVRQQLKLKRDQLKKE